MAVALCGSGTPPRAQLALGMKRSTQQEMCDKFVQKRVAQKFISDLMSIVITLGSGEMKVTLEEMRDKFDALCQEIISREELSAFAAKAMAADDIGELEMDSAHSDVIWDSIMYLLGVDLQTEPGIYLHSIEDFEEAREKFWPKDKY
ncbi:hypothetical protein [Methylobacterium tarhaniae]|uniref:hypothetical protein n=1 Tax=Methylobacterium tarhaniae TaxID=1187852 RepID=UPI001FDA3C8E|nr:hypothetical protein [Methylobacterium tarhaniae]